jgi:hypothetical protein
MIIFQMRNNPIFINAVITLDQSNGTLKELKSYLIWFLDFVCS